jgi:hypothetical protein
LPSFVSSYNGLEGSKIRALSFDYNADPESTRTTLTFAANSIRANALNLLADFAAGRKGVEVTKLAIPPSCGQSSIRY